MFSPQTLPDIVALTCILSSGLLVAIWAWQGCWRLAAPSCAKCGYDVRASHWPNDPDARCPECGAALAPPSAVACAHRHRRMGALSLALIILASPWVASFAVGLARQSRSPVLAPARAAAANPAPPQPKALFQWSGSLPVEVDVMQAIMWHNDAPISPYMLRIHPKLSWDGSPRKFKQVIALTAIYGSDGRQLTLYSPRDLRSTRDVSDLFSTSIYPGYLYVCHTLPPGEYRLRMVFDVGAVPEDAYPRGLDETWGVARKWPTPGKLWEFEHVCTVTIPAAP